MKSLAPIQRLVVHILLAVFLANAANKFFVPDLDYEAAHAFYARIFAFEGDAPDQYRILPLLPLKLLCLKLPFNTAVLLYNAVCAFCCFEVFARLMRRIPAWRQHLANVLFAGFYAYAQYTGWRPDTMGLVLIAALTLWATQLRDYMARMGLILLGVVALAFSRADFAFALAAFLAIYHVPSLPLRLLLPVLTVAVQALLQFGIFPEAKYYTHTLMLMDNLSGYYLIRNPATYLLLAAGIAFWQPLKGQLVWIWGHYRYFLFIGIAYLTLVLFVGRINEYRIYLPFWPLILLFWHERASTHEKETRSV